MANVKIIIKAVTTGNKKAKLDDKFALFAGASLDEVFAPIDLKKGRFEATGGLKHSLFYGVVAKRGTQFQVVLNEKVVVDNRVAQDSGTPQGPGHSAGHIYFWP